MHPTYRSLLSLLSSNPRCTIQLWSETHALQVVFDCVVDCLTATWKFKRDCILCSTPVDWKYDVSWHMGIIVVLFKYVHTHSSLLVFISLWKHSSFRWRLIPSRWKNHSCCLMPFGFMSCFHLDVQWCTIFFIWHWSSPANIYSIKSVLWSQWRLIRWPCAAVCVCTSETLQCTAGLQGRLLGRTTTMCLGQTV